MNVQSQLSLSYYKEIATINKSHNVTAVQDSRTGHLYVKKVLSVYNAAVFEDLMLHPIPNLPKLIEVHEDTEAHTLTVIEEYISGETLEEQLGKRSFAEKEVRDILRRLLMILSNLQSHKPAIIHRDIKPSNIILTSSGEVYLIDWNAAKYESKGEARDTILIGTKGYAAPEQFGFGSSGVKTDIYAVGVLANTLLCGRETDQIIKNSKLTEFITICTKLDPEDRFGSIKEMLNVLNGKPPKKHYPYYGLGPFPGTDPYHGKRKYLPPGFRTKNLIHEGISVLVYTMMIYLSSGFLISDVSPLLNIINNIFFFLMMLMTVLISCNYLDIQNAFPMCRSKQWWIRLLGILIYDAVAIIILFLIMIFTNALLSK